MPIQFWVVMLCYLDGSLPFAWFICKFVAHKDLRKEGSGNSGASNLRRVSGCEKYYFAAVLLDAGKGVLAILLARYLGYSLYWQGFFGFISVVGHCYPVWLKFQGGKGVASLLGVALALAWPIALGALMLFVLLKKKSGYTSLASVVAVLVFAMGYTLLKGAASMWIWMIFALIFLGHILNLNLIKLGYETNGKKPRPYLHFLFVVHPTNDRPDYLRNYMASKVPQLACLPCWFVNFVLAPLLFWLYPAAFIRPAVFWNNVPGVKGSTKPSYGLVAGVPMGPTLMMKFERIALWAISRMIRLGAMAGATHAGLGAYTAIVGNGGKVLRDRFLGRIHVTTGNDFTAWLGVYSLKLAAEKMGKVLTDCTLLIIGIGGVGDIAARITAEILPVKKIILYNRTSAKAKGCADWIAEHFPSVKVEVAHDLSAALKQADLIISATSSAKELDVDESDLSPGAIICDIARPRDLEVSREDVLVYDGGMAECPNAELPSMLGLPEGQSYGCLLQTAGLAEAGEEKCLGGIGGVYDIEQTRRIAEICFVRSGGIGALRSGDGGIITDEQIERIKQAARAARGTGE